MEGQNGGERNLDGSGESTVGSGDRVLFTSIPVQATADDESQKEEEDPQQKLQDPTGRRIRTSTPQNILIQPGEAAAVFAKRNSSGVSGDYSFFSGRSPFSVSATDSSNLVTGTREPHVFSKEILKEAEAKLSEILTPDCHPKVITLLVIDDNLSSQPPSSSTTAEPPLNSEKSLKLLKDAFESSVGSMVIPVVNSSKKYLLATLESLAKKGTLPKSCELIWFYFSGHGRGNEFCMNGDHMLFDELIDKVSAINVKYYFFCFECCLRNCMSIRAAGIKREYMAIYSAPPGEPSFHCDGVGFMSSSLVDILKQQGFKGSLNDLQLKLRDETRRKMTEAVYVPTMTESRQEFEKKHLPIHTSTMYTNVSLHTLRHDAMKPTISCDSSDGKMAKVTIYNPKKLIHHSSYELDVYRVIVNGTVCSNEVTASFDEEPLTLEVDLPWTVSKKEAKLVVEARYIGDSMTVCSDHCLVELPQYGMPRIKSCEVIKANCSADLEVDIPDFDVSSSYHEIEHVSVGYINSDSRKKVTLWKETRPRDCPRGLNVVFNPSHHPETLELEVVVKYVRCHTQLCSEPYEVLQPVIPRPKISSVCHSSPYSGTLTFSPMQPSHGGDLYKIRSYHIYSRLHGDTYWVTVLDKEPPDGELDAEVCDAIKLHLSSEAGVMCEYRVGIVYEMLEGEVKSEIFEETLLQLEPPRVQDLSSTSISWSPPNPPPPQEIQSDIEYKVERLCWTGTKELRTCDGNTNTATLERGLSFNNCRMRVSIKHKDQSLRYVSSDVFKRKGQCQLCLCKCCNACSNKVKLLGLLVITSLFLSFTALGTSRYGLSARDVLAVSNWTISSPLLKPSIANVIWFRGATITEHSNSYSDNPDGLSISAWTLPNGKIVHTNYTLDDEKYHAVNLSINSNPQKQFILDNYLEDPPNLLKNSVISVKARIHLSTSGSSISQARIYLFDSLTKAANFQSGAIFSTDADYVDIIDSTKAVIERSYTVPRESFYFPVFTSDSDSNFTLTANFTFHITQYANSPPSDSKIITKNHSAFVHFNFHTTTLLHIHPPANPVDLNMTHLDIVYEPRLEVQVSFIVAPMVVALVIVHVLISYCIAKVRKMWKLRNLRQQGSETKPLVINPSTGHPSYDTF